MKTFSHYLILFFGLFLFGCEQNEDITTVETVEPAPAETNSIFLTGQVVDLDGVAVGSARVSIYHEGAAYGTTTTDEGGYYEFPPGTVPIGRAVIEASKESYFENYALVQTDDERPADLQLLKVGTQGLTSSALGPNDSLVTISGEVINQNGEGQPGAYFLLYNETQYLGSVLTGFDGQFQLVTAAGTPAFLVGKGPCQVGQFGPLELPALQADTTLATFSGTFGSSNVATFSGSAVNCDGAALTSGTVEFRYGQGEGNRVTYPLNSDGTFSFGFFACGIDQENPVSVVVYNAAGDQSGNEAFFYDGEAFTDVGQITVCNSNDPFFQFTVEGVTYDISDEGTWREFELLGNRLIGFSGDNSICQLSWPFSSDTGTFPIQLFSYANNDQINVGIQEGNGTVEVTEVSNARVAGSFSGIMLVGEVDPEEVPIEGSFNIPL